MPKWERISEVKSTFSMTFHPPLISIVVVFFFCLFFFSGHSSSFVLFITAILIGCLGGLACFIPVISFCCFGF